MGERTVFSAKTQPQILKLSIGGWKIILVFLQKGCFRSDTNYCYYASCNKKAGLFVKKEILRNPYVYIDKKEIDRLELYEILNPDVQKKFNECWAELVKYLN